MTVIAAIVTVVVVLALAVVPTAATAATTVRRIASCEIRAMPMSECRTLLSECRTLLSDVRTNKASSLFGAILSVRRRSLTTASHESTASLDRDTCPVAPDRRAALRLNQVTEPAENQPPPLHQSQRPAIDQPNRCRNSTGRGTSPRPRRGIFVATHRRRVGCASAGFCS